MISWSGLSVSKKLYLVIGTMAVLIASELVVLRFALATLSAVRAFVGGEGSWSKAQKDAALSLHHYAVTGDDTEYTRFLQHLQVPEGDHDARVELEKPEPDLPVVRNGFLRGRIHPDDIPGMIDLLRRFHRVSYLARAIDDWRRADELLHEFKQAGEHYHDLLRAPKRDRQAVGAALERIGALNRELTTVEHHFSEVLGEGSRWLERLVITLLFLAVLTVEAVGLTMTFRITRAIARGLAEANSASARIGAGDFSTRLPVRSRDELGTLAESINEMGALLECSYRELEERVRQRTAEAEAMAQENARLYQEADAAVRMRDQFISIASHELRTPILALALQLEMVSRQVQRITTGIRERPQVLASLDTMARQNRRLSLLSTELMDLTRIRLGRLELRREPGDVVLVVTDVVQQLAPEAARVGSAVEVEAPAPVRAVFDQARMGQVATNLLSNAIKYGRGRPIRVVVCAAEGGGAVLSVQDQGAGIAPEDQSRIFERFERCAEVEGRVAGLGLGLYITRQIVEAHGGRIHIRSEPGAGSMFTVELPAGG